MDDTISRQAAIDAVSRGCQEFRGIFAECEKNLNALPSVQPQPEIIRCKECKHWGKRGLCEIWDYYISNEDFYCGCAERRTE